jgi:hypothetical protein
MNPHGTAERFDSLDQGVDEFGDDNGLDGQRIDLRNGMKEYDKGYLSVGNAQVEWAEHGHAGSKCVCACGSTNW